MSAMALRTTLLSSEHRSCCPIFNKGAFLWRRVAGLGRRHSLPPSDGNRHMLICSMSAAASSNGDMAGVGDSQGPRVCVLGGGFGGLYTAVKLESLMWPKGNKPQVTLIDQSDRFVFKPLLYELLTGAATEDEVAPTFSRLLAPYPITFLQGKVAAVQPQTPTQDGGSVGGGTVLLSDGLSVPYDWLVLALGAETNTFGVPGVKELALPFATYDDAMKIIARLDLLDANVMHPELVVVGGGYSGVEVAAVVAEQLGGRGRIKLLTSGADILPSSTEGQREAAKEALRDKGISILTGAAVTQIVRAAAHPLDEGTADLTKRLVYLTDKEEQQEILEADLVIWAAGSTPVPKVESGRLSLPFPSDARGATQTDPTLRVVGHQRVFALGDIAMSRRGGSVGAIGGGDLAPTAAQLPATAQVAFQQSDYVAWNIWSAINNKPLLNFSYQHLGDMMSLGTTNGAVALPIPLPPPLSTAVQAGPLGELLKIAGVRITPTLGGDSSGVTVEGPLAAALRRVAYLYRQPTDEQRLRVAASWAQQAAKQAAGIAQQVLTGTPPGRGGRDGSGSS